jgi:hypothetical protein
MILNGEWVRIWKEEAVTYCKVISWNSMALLLFLESTVIKMTKCQRDFHPIVRDTVSLHIHRTFVSLKMPQKV